MGRIILDGMDRDRTCVNYITAYNVTLPRSATILDMWGNKLPFIGYFREGQLQRFSKKRAERMPVKRFSALDLIFEGPQTLFAEDGRIFSGAEQRRLDSTIKDI